MSEPLTPYSIVDVSDWEFVREELIGGEEKYWLEQPEAGRRWLFKPDNYVQNCAEPWYQREGVTEKIACELATKIGLPCAEIELATRNGRPGCISLDLAPHHWQLHTGAVILGGMLPDYVPGEAQGNNSARKGHSLSNIRRALDGHEPQPGFKLPDNFDAFDTFVGYLVFDALIANRDRHDENWAVLIPPKRDLRPALAGSFDHARALGCTLSDTKVAGVVGNGIKQWVERGTAWRFERDLSQPTPTLVEVVRQSFSLVDPAVREHWLGKVQDLTPEHVKRVTQGVPKLSEVVGTFIEQVVEVNRGRLLDDY